MQKCQLNISKTVLCKKIINLRQNERKGLKGKKKRLDLHLDSSEFLTQPLNPPKNWNRPFEAAPRYVSANISAMSFINVSPVD